MTLGKVVQSRSMRNMEHILEVASQLFVAKGVRNTSLSDIAKEAGISKGTLYYYFTSKDDLIFDITERHIAGITDNLNLLLSNPDDKNPFQIIYDSFRILVEDNVRGRLHLYLVQEAMSGNEALQKRFLKNYKLWNKIILQAISVLMPNSANMESLSQLIVATLDGLTVQSAIHLPGLDIKGIAELLSLAEFKSPD